MKKPLPTSQWGRCLHEQYEKYEYLGFFDSAPASDKRIAIVVAHLVEFLSVVELLPDDRKEDPQGVMIDEGAPGSASALQRKRSAELRRRAREHYREDGILRCEVCGYAKPASVGPEVIQIHHLRQIKSFNPKGEKKKLSAAIRNVRPLCPNCHAIAHSNRTRPLGLTEIAKHLGL
jgi:predicted HNH restriction endonuclease